MAPNALKTNEIYEPVARPPKTPAGTREIKTPPARIRRHDPGYQDRTEAPFYQQVAKGVTRAHELRGEEFYRAIAAAAKWIVRIWQ